MSRAVVSELLPEQVVMVVGLAVTLAGRLVAAVVRGLRERRAALLSGPFCLLPLLYGWLRWLDCCSDRNWLQDARSCRLWLALSVHTKA